MALAQQAHHDQLQRLALAHDHAFEIADHPLTKGLNIHLNQKIPFHRDASILRAFYRLGKETDPSCGRGSTGALPLLGEHFRADSRRARAFGYNLPRTPP